jgi:hypothetical protein
MGDLVWSHQTALPFSGFRNVRVLRTWCLDTIKVFSSKKGFAPPTVSKIPIKVFESIKVFPSIKGFPSKRLKCGIRVAI